MPLWEFICQTCNKEFEVFQQSLNILSKEIIECSYCKSRKVKKKFSAAIIDINGVVRMNEKQKREHWSNTTEKSLK